MSAQGDIYSKERKIDSVGRVNIPVDMRYALGLKEGDMVTFILKEGPDIELKVTEE